MADFQTIIVARPLSETDPIFLKAHGGYIFPRILKEYERAGMVENVIVSMPDTVSPTARDLFASWGLDCAYSTATYRNAGLLN